MGNPTTVAQTRLEPITADANISLAKPLASEEHYTQCLFCFNAWVAFARLHDHVLCKDVACLAQNWRASSPLVEKG